ncbi:MATE efflux family protein [Gonapodya prolifera JEL478]|uniref:MATE efflux family protein n=1 Tax=Gonapodya prolifera (strain JEL478) TaxID=1344416 RepID=A0A139AIC7_GONPJ|nr:MATE efflux family protein [Gonapodya prolifera JEL478]|eukprot:KXS16294.1 MATE efflux family protein [Gonapodya prolifera JEL478]
MSASTARVVESPGDSAVSAPARASTPNATNINPRLRNRLILSPKPSFLLEIISTTQSTTTTALAPLTPREILTESNHLVRLATPVSLAFILGMSNQIVSMLFIGHIGTTELAGAAMGLMYTNLVGFSVGAGLATALDTFASQANSAAKDPTSALGKILMQSVVILVIIAIPLSLALSLAEPLLLALGQDAEVSRLAGIWSVCVIPALFASFVGECLKRVLQAQGIMNGGPTAALFSLLISLPLLVLLVGTSPIPSTFPLSSTLTNLPTLNLGFSGAPLCVTLSSWSYFAALVAYARFGAGGKAWGVVKAACTWGNVKAAVGNKRGWTMFMRLGVPGAMMVAAEWWAFELTSLLAGWLGPHSLASHSIITTTGSLTYMLPLGVAVAVTNRIGNALGAGNARAARTAAVTGIIIGAGLGMLNGGFLLWARDWWGYVFVGGAGAGGHGAHGETDASSESDAEDVVQTVSSALPIVAAFQLNDALASVSGGCIRGAGHHRVGAILNGAAYYLVGLPAAAALSFRHRKVDGETLTAGEEAMVAQGRPDDVERVVLPQPSKEEDPRQREVFRQREGLRGIWMGLSAGLILMSMMQVRFVLRMDWKREIERARRRVGAVTASPPPGAAVKART